MAGAGIDEVILNPILDGGAYVELRLHQRVVGADNAFPHGDIAQVGTGHQADTDAEIAQEWRSRLEKRDSFLHRLAVFSRSADEQREDVIYPRFLQLLGGVAQLLLGKSLAHDLQHLLRAGVASQRDGATACLAHEADKLLIEERRMQGAQPEEIQFSADDGAADLLRVLERHVENGVGEEGDVDAEPLLYRLDLVDDFFG